jgi:hypothetical protein
LRPFGFGGLDGFLRVSNERREWYGSATFKKKKWRQGRGRKEGTNLEVDRQLVKQIKLDRDRLDVAVRLVLVTRDRLEEDDALVLGSEHLHEGLHEVLRGGVEGKSVLFAFVLDSGAKGGAR